MTSYAICLADVQAAALRIKAHVHVTPVMTCSALDELAGRSLFCKCELFQRGGSFKIRGATNAVMSLSDEAAARGVTTHSSGNHAQAIALAAKARGIGAKIVMPSNAPAVKKRAVLGYGAEVIECESTGAARQAAADLVVAETGAYFVHPSNNPTVMAGQGTIALELLEQVADLDAVIVPIGGGGMMSGIVTAVKGLNPSIKVYAAEPAGAADAYRSKEGGVLVGHPPGGPSTIADGLRTTLGTNTFPIVRDLVDEIFLVEEEEIVAAMRLVWERMKLCIEPSAAVGVAVALSAAFKALPLDGPDGCGARVGVILCGGNTNLDALPWQS
jgi:threonine dehydratase/serine racemase